MNDHLQIQTSNNDSSSSPFYLSSYSLLKVEGTGAMKLLQGQLTCDVVKLPENQAVWGAHCNAKGRIVSLFQLFREKEVYYLLMRRDMIPIALTALKKYAIFYQVKLSEITHPIFITHFEPPAPCHSIKLFDTFYLALNASFTIFQPENAWKKILIQQKIPTLYPETSGKLLPHEIRLDELNGLCFNKGCYTGQEIIARMHYLGKTKNNLYHARVNHSSPPIIGGTIKTTGMLIDYCHEEQDIYHILIRDKKIDDEKNESH